METHNFKIAILEDDDFYNQLLSNYLKSNLETLGILKGFTVSISSYTSFRDCSMNLQKDTTILFSDFYLNDGYKAPVIIKKIQEKGINCKVVVMSRTYHLEKTIAPILAGTVEFIHKNSRSLKRSLEVSEAILMEHIGITN